MTFCFPKSCILSVALLAGVLPNATLGETLERAQEAIDYFQDPRPLYDFSCETPDVQAGCEGGELCKARLGTLTLFARAMDSRLPKMISDASRQAWSEFGRGGADAACLAGLVGQDAERFFPNVEKLARADLSDLDAALGTEVAFSEEAPGCPTTSVEAPTVARYSSSDLPRQVTYPLRAIGKNTASDCVDGAEGAVTQRPQITFHLTDMESGSLRFEVFYAQCDVTLLAAGAGGTWIPSRAGAKRPAVELSGDELAGRVDLWIGTTGDSTECEARFRARRLD